jgi:autotransporter-associated beta strand protein
MLPFVGHYQTNLTTNLTPATNAAVDILSSMARLWQTGTAWNNGVVLAPEVLRANMLYCVRITTTRTEAAAKESFIIDRQDNSYAMIDGLGPLAALYKTGALAVTSITTAPDGTPPTTVSDGVPPGAPAGSATGAGSTTSALGDVALLVNTLRGSYSSSNPSKYAYQYPRPWRMTDDSTVIDTGTVDGYGFPVYKSDVIVAPQLLRQRSLTPATDGGFPSGHTNAFFLAGLALAYAIPERFQELVTRAYENANYRIIAGMHSPTDVVGGRILGTALAAAILNDPANATIKANARSQALAYFEAQSGNTADTLYAYAHSAGPDTDPYASREVNARTIAPYFTYILPRRGPDTAMTVPQGAEVLLETRQPYLSADQRREVLRTTALPAGYDLLDGPEQWGRLNLFAAADGYGEFDSDVQVTMDAANGGFRAADAWRNDIGGPGGLTKLGAGQLTLTGVNRYRGGTQIQAGTLVAASPNALGLGDVRVSGGATLQLPLHGDRRPALEVDGTVTLAPDSVLAIQLDSPAPGEIRPVISAQRIHGKFGTITVSPAGYQAEPLYSTTGLSVRITR